MGLSGCGVCARPPSSASAAAAAAAADDDHDMCGRCQVEKAIERLEAAVRIDPTHAKAQAKLRDARKELEDKVEAFKKEVDGAINKAQKMMDRGEL